MVRVELLTSAVLLTGEGASAPVEAVAFDADGEVVEASIEWVSEDPDLNFSEGLVTATAAVGSAQFHAAVGQVRSAVGFALIAVPVEGAVLLDDSAIGAIAGQEGQVFGAGARYTVQVSGLDAPSPGTPVIARGTAPVMGLFVEEDEGWVLELAPPDQVFSAFAVQETWSVRDLEPVVRLEGYEVVEDEEGFTLVPPAERAEFDLGPFECEAEGQISWPLKLSPPSYTIDPDVDVELDWDSSGFHALVLRGRVTARAELGFTFTDKVEGSLECDIEFFELPIPIAGPLSAIAGLSVEVGLGFAAEGEFTVVDFGLTAWAQAEATCEVGLVCDEGCDWLTDASMETDAGLEANAPDFGEDLRLEVGLSLFVLTELELGTRIPLLVADDEVDLLALREGIKETLDLAPVEKQAEDGDYRSYEKFGPYLELYSPVYDDASDALQPLAQLMGIDLPELHWEPELVAIAESPRGDPGAFSLDAEELAAGEVVRGTVELDPQTLTWFSVDNVGSVAMYGQFDGELTELARVEGVPGQATYELEWTPTEAQAAAPPILTAFIEPAWWPAFGAVELEVTEDSRIGFGGCALGIRTTDLQAGDIAALEAQFTLLQAYSTYYGSQSSYWLSQGQYSLADYYAAVRDDFTNQILYLAYVIGSLNSLDDAVGRLQGGPEGDDYGDLLWDLEGAVTTPQDVAGAEHSWILATKSGETVPIIFLATSTASRSGSSAQVDLDFSGFYWGVSYFQTYLDGTVVSGILDGQTWVSGDSSSIGAQTAEAHWWPNEEHTLALRLSANVYQSSDYPGLEPTGSLDIDLLTWSFETFSPGDAAECE